MLTIRQAQMAVFQERAIADFVDRMTAYISAEYPGHYARMQESGTRELILKGIEKAREKAITSRGAVAVYLELLLCYGENLEHAPDRVWVDNTLNHPVLPDYIRVGSVRDRLDSLTQGRLIRPVQAGQAQ